MSLSELDEEREYLARSLADLEAEREVGDIEEHRYRELKARYEERASEVAAAFRLQARVGGEGGAGGDAAEPARRDRSSFRRLSSRRARLVTGWTGFACLVAAAAILSMAVGQVGPFAASPTLSVNDRVQIELAEASVLGANGHVAEALRVYDKVLELDPRQPEALADGGWLTRVAGISEHEPSLVRDGDGDIEAAVDLSPGLAVARAYDGVLCYQDRSDPKKAVFEFGQMLDDHPSKALLYSVRSVASQAYRATGDHVPAAVADATKP